MGRITGRWEGAFLPCRVALHIRTQYSKIRKTIDRSGLLWCSTRTKIRASRMRALSRQRSAKMRSLRFWLREAETPGTVSTLRLDQSILDTNSPGRNWQRKLLAARVRENTVRKSESFGCPCPRLSGRCFIVRQYPWGEQTSSRPVSRAQPGCSSNPRTMP